MIVLKDDNIIEIPNYDDLDNKPKINGVVLEGNKTTTQLGLNVDLSGFYTKTQSDDRFQPKGNYQPAGNYLTSVPSEYVTDGELSAKNYATKSEIPVIPANVSYFNNDSGYITNSALAGYATETYVSDNYQPKGNYQPAGNYLTSIPSEYITEGELNDALAAQLNSKQDTLVSGTNIKTINGNSILGSGDLTIEGGTTDLSNYYTKTESDNKFQEKGDYLTAVPSEYVTETELNNTLNQKDYATETYVDTQIGNINTILENIIG